MCGMCSRRGVRAFLFLSSGNACQGTFRILWLRFGGIRCECSYMLAFYVFARSDNHCIVLCIA